MELLEDGKVVQRIEHEGITGATDKNNGYAVHLDDTKPGAKFTLRASVRSDGGSRSNGDIYLLPLRK